MAKKFILMLSAVLFCLPLTALSGPKDDVSIKIDWTGTVRDTSINVIPDPGPMQHFTDVIDAQAKGSFGPSNVTVVTEFFEMAGVCESQDDLYLQLGHSTLVTTFSNDDQLYGYATWGYLCMDLATGIYEGHASGLYTGGTGRFENATGVWETPYDGKNLTILTYGFGFGNIYGTLTGTLQLD